MLGMRARNHPQQVISRGARDDVDDRQTDPRLFELWHDRFHFTIDVAAAAHNAQLDRYYTRDDDGLAQDWTGERVWCNPPYSHIEPWIRKALDRQAELVVLLLPANRTEQKWWQNLIEPLRDRPGTGVRVEFLPGRPRFLEPGDEQIRRDSRPPFGCCLVIIEQAGGDL